MRMDRRDLEKPRTRMSISSLRILQKLTYCTACWHKPQASERRKVHPYRPRMPPTMPQLMEKIALVGLADRLVWTQPQDKQVLWNQLSQIAP